MNYNTSRKRLKLPEYGRHIQILVDHIQTIPTKEERNHVAKQVIRVMGNLYPHLRDVDAFKHKLWDHLAIMSDFNIDIDYPEPPIKPEILAQKPPKLGYPQSRIKYRHYGKVLERMILKIKEYYKEDEKKHLIYLISNHMRKSFIIWNKDFVENQKIIDDLKELSKGEISLALDDIKFNDDDFNLKKKQQKDRSKNKKQ